MSEVVFSFEIATVLFILALTVLLFVSEIVRVDVAAICILVLIGIVSYLPGLENIANVSQLFDGFSSNAVISIIAVMIIGAGLDKTGAVSIIANQILKYCGRSEGKVISLIAATVGVISSFMQNIGAAALFLPVVSRISLRSDIPMSRLLMPMGFCAILGGTITLVGSSPLILLNDLITSTEISLPSDQQLQSFKLFDVTPIGLCLLIVGITYFVVFGRIFLPSTNSDGDASSQSAKEYFQSVYGLDGQIYEIEVSANSALVGQTSYLGEDSPIEVIAIHQMGDTILEPTRDTIIESGAVIAVIAKKKPLDEFVKNYDLNLTPELKIFAESLSPNTSGIAELVIPPGSELIGQTARGMWIRKTYGLSLIAIYRGDHCFSRQSAEHSQSDDVGDVPFQAGDIIVCHTRWESLTRLKTNRNFVIITADYPQEELRPKKLGFALTFLAIALVLVLFSEFRLSLCLLVGAVGMILTGVLNIDEAYRAISWNTVFLLASLIPLGVAVQSTGTAAWIAQNLFTLLDGMPIWVWQVALALLATGFTLVMSNVGATVLLVPLAINIAIVTGGDPSVFALIVALSTSNSFLIPTHQVNALIMGPGGYTVKDFIRAGGVMSILFLITLIIAINIFF